MAKCPVCKRSSGFYREPVKVYPGKTVLTPVPLYQRSYLGQPGYISERCGKCFDKTLRMETRRESRKNSEKGFQKTVPAVPGEVPRVRSSEGEHLAHNQRVEGSNPSGPTKAPVCKNCLNPLGAIAELTDLDRLTEKVLGSCLKCLQSTDEYVATKLNAEPDWDNAIIVSGYAHRLNAPEVLAIPLRKRRTFWNRRPKLLTLWCLEPIRE